MGKGLALSSGHSPQLRDKIWDSLGTRLGRGYKEPRFVFIHDYHLTVLTTKEPKYASEICKYRNIDQLPLERLECN